MKMRIGAILLTMLAVAACFLSPVSSFANANVTSSVSHVQVYVGTAATGAIVWISPAIQGLGGCSHTQGDELWIDFTSTTATPDPKTVYATVLAAFLAGKSMQFGINGCGDAGQLPLIYSVDVYP